MKTISNYYTISAYICSFVEYFEILKSKKTEKMLHLKKYFLLTNFSKQDRFKYKKISSFHIFYIYLYFILL